MLIRPAEARLPQPPQGWRGPCQPWQKKWVMASAALKVMCLKPPGKIIHLGHVARKVAWKYREVTAREEEEEEKKKAKIHYWK